MNKEIRSYALEIRDQAVIAKTHVWSGVAGALGNRKARETFQVIRGVIEEDPDRPATVARQEIEKKLGRKL